MHATVYTPEHSPDAARVAEETMQMAMDLLGNVGEIRQRPRPGIVNGLINMRIDGQPAPDLEIMGMLTLIIGGGFDTTTAFDRPRVGVAIGEPATAGTAQQRARYPPQFRHRGVSALLHTRAR